MMNMQKRGLEERMENYEPWKEYTLEKHNKLNYSRSEYLSFIAVGIGASLAMNVLSGQPQNLSGLDQILMNAKYVWLAYSPITALSGYGILRYNPKEDFYLERKQQSDDYKVIFQITTRGFNTEAVERSVKSVLYWVPKYLKDYEIWIVTEDDVDKKFFESLKEIDDEARKRVKVIYVPKNYRTPHNTKYKARALNYAMELRKMLGYDSKKTWVYLMDEESIVGEDTVVGIIDFIENESKKGKLIGQGLIVYSNFWGRNLLTSLADGGRPVWEYVMEYLPTKWFGKKYSWKGSHLLINSELENKISWDFGILGDDLIFGLFAQKKTKVGIIRGFLYEQSPFNIKDLIKQRYRWFKSLIEISKYKTLSFLDRLILKTKIFLWYLALPSFILWMHNPLDPLYIGMVITTYISFIYGTKINIFFSSNMSKRKVINYLLTPLSILTISIVPWIGTIWYINEKGKKNISFEVIKK